MLPVLVSTVFRAGMLLVILEVVIAHLLTADTKIATSIGQYSIQSGLFRCCP